MKNTDTPQDPTALFVGQGSPKVVRVDFNFNGTGDTHFSYLTHKEKDREIVCHSPANMTADQHARISIFCQGHRQSRHRTEPPVARTKTYP